MRRRIGYSIRRSRGGIFSAYIFSHGAIKKSCPKGIWQFDMVTHGKRKIPYLFFTCPKCGQINKDYVNVESFEGRAYFIEYCHNCRFCGTKVPFTIEGGMRKIRTEYRRIMERAGLGDRKEGNIDSLYVDFASAIASGILTAVGKQDYIRAYRIAFRNAGCNDFDAVLETAGP